MACVATVFDDKRLTCVFLMSWLILVLSIFSHLGVMSTQFMSFGPSDKTFFMGVQLNTWYAWTWVAIFTFLSTAINDFVGDAVVPWIQNTVQDHKSHYIPYSKLTCWLITQCWSLYCCIMGVFSIYLLMSQIDFLVIRALADGLVNSYTCYKFLKDKKTNPEKYARWFERERQESDDEGEGSSSQVDVAVEARADDTTSSSCEQEMKTRDPLL